MCPCLCLLALEMCDYRLKKWLLKWPSWVSPGVGRTARLVMKLRVKNSAAQVSVPWPVPFPLPKADDIMSESELFLRKGIHQPPASSDFAATVILLLLLLLLNPKAVVLEYATLLIIHKAGKNLSLAQTIQCGSRESGVVGTFLSVKSAALTQKHPRNRSVALEGVNLTLLLESILILTCLKSYI